MKYTIIILIAILSCHQPRILPYTTTVQADTNLPDGHAIFFTDTALHYTEPPTVIPWGDTVTVYSYHSAPFTTLAKISWKKDTGYINTTFLWLR